MGPAGVMLSIGKALFMPIFSMSDTNFEVVKKYCDDVISGRILAGRYCKQAVLRFLSDLEKSQNPDFPYFLDVEAADEVIDFAETLVKQGHEVTVLTGKPNYGYQHILKEYKHVKCEFIGEGNKAFARLNMMKATICFSTTPGLEVYQWKRSKECDYYIQRENLI